MPAIRIRPATAADSARIAEMANALNTHHELEPAFTAAKVERDGFGPDAAFACLLVEADGAVVGYAMYHDSYNSDLAERGLWLVDLYVEPAHRAAGIGRRLMAALARIAIERGAVSLWWGVSGKNAQARAMYAGIGAHDYDYRLLEMDRADLERLAAEASA